MTWVMRLSSSFVSCQYMLGSQGRSAAGTCSKPLPGCRDLLITDAEHENCRACSGVSPLLACPGTTLPTQSPQREALSLKTIRRNTVSKVVPSPPPPAKQQQPQNNNNNKQTKKLSVEWPGGTWLVKSPEETLSVK